MIVTKNIIKGFINAINDYDGSSDTQENLKNYLCFIAENKKQIDSNLQVDSLIDIASTKMKAFGYSILNKSFNMEVSSYIGEIVSQSIKTYHRSFNSSVILDGMQRNIIDKYQSLEDKRIMLSAPTSFGKTFLLQEILFINSKEYKNVMVVLPTVALLQENALNILIWLQIKNLIIISLLLIMKI
jgi:reverse gyrase